MKQKNILLVLAVLCTVLLSACSTMPTNATAALQNKIPDMQTIISALVPPSYKGDYHWDHHNLYFNFTLDVGNLHKDANGQWTWDWLNFVDSNGLWHGGIRFGKVPLLLPTS